MLKEAVCWWPVLAVVWLLTASGVTETVAAAVCAVPCAFIAAAARRALGDVPRPRARWWRWFAGVPKAVVTETLAALRVRDEGRTETLRLPDDRIEARQAVATVAIGLSPGAMVADIPEDAHAVVVHRLVPERSQALDEVRR